MKIQLIRHASLWLQYDGKTILVDPMFADAEQFPAFPNTPNDKRNPLVSLPEDKKAWLSPDLIIVTHPHMDHWDAVASSVLSTSIPILCQPEDKQLIMDAGFKHVNTLPAQGEATSFFGIQISRTSGQHGTGEIGQRMGTVSGVVLKVEKEPSLYIIGDSIWCEDVITALDEHQPQVIVANAGGARFLMGDPITMDEQDIASLCRYTPNSTIVAVHMDAINHCVVTREQLRTQLEKENLLEQVIIPADGEWVTFENN